MAIKHKINQQRSKQRFSLSVVKTTVWSLLGKIKKKKDSRYRWRLITLDKYDKILIQKYINMPIFFLNEIIFLGGVAILCEYKGYDTIKVTYFLMETLIGINCFIIFTS